ncbi:MAG: aldo/keto reductase [Candidatus Marinimicrobia bacterium]|nr:aldo/keto reductase [Candidatus Neomarinimicrobiota bacterium]
MEMRKIGPTALRSSRLVHGCMRLVGDGSAAARARGLAALEAAVEVGINHFDHADIYGRGASEALFCEFLAAHPGLRGDLIITSKCGVRRADDPQAGAPARYDLSAAHMESAVEGILTRLGLEQIDILLLHRPDYLMDPDEIAGVFARLHGAGKVAHFGVSNLSPSQLEMIRQVSPFPLVMHQVEFNLHRVAPLTDGVLDQCRRRGITPQAWCPLGAVAYPAWGSTLSPAQTERLRGELERQAGVYGSPPAGIALAWILRHPAGVLPVIGSMSPAHIRDAVAALDLAYTREDWYRLLEARQGKVP